MPSRLQGRGTLTFGAVCLTGSLRSLVTVDRWLGAGLEMLALGAVVAVGAYASGAFVSWLVPGIG